MVVAAASALADGFGGCSSYSQPPGGPTRLLGYHLCLSSVSFLSPCEVHTPDHKLGPQGGAAGQVLSADLDLEHGSVRIHSRLPGSVASTLHMTAHLALAACLPETPGATEPRAGGPRHPAGPRTLSADAMHARCTEPLDPRTVRRSLPLEQSQEGHQTPKS